MHSRQRSICTRSEGGSSGNYQQKSSQVFYRAETVFIIVSAAGKGGIRNLSGEIIQKERYIGNRNCAVPVAVTLSGIKISGNMSFSAQLADRRIFPLRGRSRIFGDRIGTAVRVHFRVYRQGDLLDSTASVHIAVGVSGAVFGAVTSLHQDLLVACVGMGMLRTA